MPFVSNDIRASNLEYRLVYIVFEWYSSNVELFVIPVNTYMISHRFELFEYEVNKKQRTSGSRSTTMHAFELLLGQNSNPNLKCSMSVT